MTDAALNVVRLCRLMLKVSLASAAFAGCTQRGEELGFVTGRVTLDGKPLAGASVTYQPQQKGSISAAETNADGQFEVLYSRSRKGALIGTHIVKIRGPEAEDDKPAAVRLPAIYNDRSELLQEVNAGDNVHDFDLATSKRK